RNREKRCRERSADGSPVLRRRPQEESEVLFGTGANYAEDPRLFEDWADFGRVGGRWHHRFSVFDLFVGGRRSGKAKSSGGSDEACTWTRERSSRAEGTKSRRAAICKS